MDYGRLSRRELQSLCKEHGIPANKTNVFMAEALGALLNAPKENHTEGSAPDPVEVVAKARGIRSQQDSSSGKGSGELAPAEIEDLSSHLAQNNLQGGEPSEMDVSEKRQNVPGKNDEIALEVVLDVNNVEAETGKEKSRKTKSRAQKSKVAKSNRTVANDAPIDGEMEIFEKSDKGNVEPELHPNVASVEDLTWAEEAPLQATYSRRERKQEDSDAADAEDFSSTTIAIPTVVSESSSTDDVAAPSAIDSLAEEQSELITAVSKPTAKKGRGKGRKAKAVKPTSPAPSRVEDEAAFVDTEEKEENVSLDAAVFAPVLANVDTEEKEEKVSLDAVEHDVSQEHELPAVPLPKGKVSKAKAKRTKKVKPPSALVESVEEIPSLTNDRGRGAFEVTDSPAFGLALEADKLNFERSQSGEVRRSPSIEDDAFEFKPDPSSLTEIMSPMPPLDIAPVTTCQHRAGRKSGVTCGSCVSERKVAVMMQSMLQSFDQRAEDALPPVEVSASVVLQQVTATVKADLPMTTPVKNAGEDKENSLNNVDLNSMSLRKLQKEMAQRKERKGLSKRNNSRVNARLAEV